MARLGLVDGRITSGVCALAHKLGLERLVGMKPLRRSIPNWTHNSWDFQHCDQGGITTSWINGCCLSFGSRPPGLQAMPYAVPRDVSTVLCVQAPALKYRPAPPKGVVLPL
jgi:hypothetical protein